MKHGEWNLSRILEGAARGVLTVGLFLEGGILGAEGKFSSEAAIALTSHSIKAASKQGSFVNNFFDIKSAGGAFVIGPWIGAVDRLFAKDYVLYATYVAPYSIYAGGAFTLNDILGTGCDKNTGGWTCN